MLIYLIRHGLADRTTGVPYHIAPGPPLMDVGIQQAAASAQLLRYAAIERVVSSPMRRCTMTAQPLCERFGLELQIDDDLGEMQPGEPATQVALRMMRAVLAHVDSGAVALVSHAAPLEQLMLTLTHQRVVLPPPGEGGARFGVADVWQMLRHGGEWHASYLPVGGIPA